MLALHALRCYLVDLKHGGCTCPDTPPKGARCKHEVAATYVKGKTALCVGCGGRYIATSSRRETATSPPSGAICTARSAPRTWAFSKMGTSRDEARRRIFAEAGFSSGALERFERAERDVLAGDHYEDAAERHAVNESDLAEFIDLAQGKTAP